MWQRKVSSKTFYEEYSGHQVKHLKILYPLLRDASDSLIWTAGDSSLDNKYWFYDQQPAVGVYRDVLDPPVSNADVTYWMNYLIENNDDPQSGTRKHRLAAINTAVEATTINERVYHLRPQDCFIRDNIQPCDTLVVSIGGNDVAMAPTPCTIASILGLLWCLPTVCLESGKVCGTVPINDCCCGCGASLCSCTCAVPPCLGYMNHLFGVRVQKYIETLTAKTKPKKILVCMIYYPDETATASWAGQALKLLGYNTNPAKLQLMIRRAFTEATSNIRIPGSKVIPVPLFHVLDGKNSRDYIARVEPSSQGGRKMADYLLHMMDSNDNDKDDNASALNYGATHSSATTPAPTTAACMAERS